MSIDVNIGDVFYKIEATDHKQYYRKCRVCEGKKELTVNGITFKCPMCQAESDVLRVYGYFVRRYRVYAITDYIYNADWKYDGEKPKRKYDLYHKSGHGRYSYNCEHKTCTVNEMYFNESKGYFDCPAPSWRAIDSYLYSNYSLAVEVANKLTQEQVERVREYNEKNGTDYELPVFLIEHDKKSN